MSITVRTGSDSATQLLSYQNGMLSDTEAGFTVTTAIDLGEDEVIKNATSEEQIAARVSEIVDRTGLTGTVYIGPTCDL